MPITGGVLVVGIVGVRWATGAESFIKNAIATPTTMVLIMARMPMDASTAIMTLRAVHGSPDENHENQEYNR
jgi:hypothetical protein